MTAKVKSMLQCVLVLAAIALVSGLLLGAFHIITYVDPLQATLDGFRSESGAVGEFTMVLDQETESNEGKIIYYAVSETDGIHAFLASAVSERKGEFQIYVYIRDNQIYKLVVGEHGDEYVPTLENAKFFDRFLGIDLADLNALDVDIVSGATMTSKAVQKAIDAVVQYYKENVAGGQS